MPNSKYGLQIQRYCGIMENIKMRTSIVGTCLAQPVFPAPFIYETCFLQFRMICELISLGCLVAHGDIPGSRSKWFRKTIDVPAMIRQMERLHPDFYPRPSVQCTLTDGSLGIKNQTEPYLTKDALVDLYTKCGGILHIGSYAQNFEARKPKARRFAEISRVMALIANLLNHHQITLSDEGYELWVLMQARADGRVHGHLMKAEG